MIKLRPHHLLCLQKYTGHGYSREFTGKMDQTMLLLRSEPGDMVKLVAGADDLCTPCPNRDGLRCASNEKVLRMDEAVLHSAHLRYGETDSWKTLTEKTASLLEPEFFENICGACEWFPLCRETKRGIRNDG